MTIIAAKTPSITAAMFSASDGTPVQLPSASSTEMPTKAPTEIKAPWPKLITSIRPNTSVRPEAMMKIIMPIASPDTVSVSQLEVEPMAKKPSTTSTGTSSSGAEADSRSPRLRLAKVGL